MATNQALIHYALDTEAPPLLACDMPEVGAISSPTASEVTCPRCLASEHFPRLKATAVSRYAVLMNAADLLSEDGENPEYDRALAELTASLMDTDDTILMARILWALKQGETK